MKYTRSWSINIKNINSRWYTLWKDSCFARLCNASIVDEKPFEGVCRNTTIPLVSLTPQEPITKHSFVGDVLNTYMENGGSSERGRILDMLADCSSSCSKFHISLPMVWVLPSLFSARGAGVCLLPSTAATNTTTTK